MTLKEAIESGRPFKRKDWSACVVPNVTDRHYSHNEVVADDWNIEEEAINITKSQLLDAMNHECSHNNKTLPEEFSFIAKRLGFKEDL